MLGLGLRFLLAAVCWGTNDANRFGQFGFQITRSGLTNTYINNEYLNHPPIPAFWSVAAWRLTIPFIEADGRLYSDHLTEQTPGRFFSAVFKIPTLIAECLTAWLLHKIWRRRAGATAALGVTAAFAWSLAAILVSGYHCNTDPIYAFLCLLCVYLLQEKRAYFLGGLMLAAAINVKLTPVLLIPPLLLWHRSWPAAAKFLGGLAIGVIPFIPIFYCAGHSFYANAIAYKSNADNWGILYLLMRFDKPPDSLNFYYPKDHYLATKYFDYGRYLVLGLIGLWALAARKSTAPAAQASGVHAAAGNGTPGPGRPFDLYDIAAVTMAIFLFFTPGFGVQYVVIPLPLMFAARPRAAGLFGFLAGLFIFIVYWSYWSGHWPVGSYFKGMYPWPSPLWGLASWLVLGYFLFATVLRRKSGTGWTPAAANLHSRSVIAPD